MSFYRRFISYMYDSTDTSKRKNCGFVKIEIRNNKHCFHFQLKDAPCQNKCNIYLYQKERQPDYIFLKEIPIKNGSTNHKLTANYLGDDKYPIPFDQCLGLLCTDEQGNICSTCWDAECELPEYNITEEKKTLSAEEPVENDIETKTNYIEDTPKTFPEIWSHLQKEFSPMDPFEDDAIIETIKISPSDLGYLQSFQLNLGSNHFLLHGYKSYHHLLLGRIRGQNQYILGIPGIYDPQEQFMAKMFGFPCFKSIRDCRQKNGQFGYWLKCFK